MTLTRLFSRCATVVATMLLASRSTAQTPESVTVPGLGTLSFPVTTSSGEARQAFLRGALLLHLFHYPAARAAFRQAEQLDSGFTMAWWGEAMAWNYGVWNQQFPDSARAALARLGPYPAPRVAKARTPRERDYLATVETLYGPGTKPHRDTVYAAAAAQLSETYPDDDEARLFYALALLGLNQGVRDIPTYGRALALATDVFRRHPDNPGASHYVIHASDDPAHAALGLDAARALAKSSPAADHAQHMTSHIFMALGMWDDLVTANERATHVDTMAGMSGMKGSGCGHYNYWLDYGYVAQGRIALATALLERCKATARSPSGAVDMWSHYLIDTEDWSGPESKWTAQFSDPDDRATYHFARGLAAARRGDTSAAVVASRSLQQDRADAIAQTHRAHDTQPATVQALRRLEVLDLELQALIQSDAGKHDVAIGLLHRATGVEDGMAYAFGPPEIDKPSHELLGEELLLAGQPAAAGIEFQKALTTTPLRPLALRGLARADDAAKLPAGGKSTWRQLAGVWHGADASLPGLDEARRKGAN
ncbi:MAG: hypothetical protein ACRELE_00075 [Gemmatimonadales bacterium]